jgi:hypothetical protein
MEDRSILEKQAVDDLLKNDDTFYDSEWDLKCLA